MICKNCQKEIKENTKFCNFCGLKIEKEITKTSFKQIILNLFDLKRKKNLIESVVLCIILVGFILPIYFIVPSTTDQGDYLINGLICFVLSLALSLFKKDRLWYLWSFLSGFIGYLLGMYVGILIIFFPFMRKGENDELNLGQIEKQFIYSFYKSGILLYLFGSVATLVSYVYPSESGTYTIFYGAVIWGLIKIFQGIYYQSKPEIILQKINENYKKNGEYTRENTAFKITPGFKKILIYFSIIIIAIIIIGIISGL